MKLTVRQMKKLQGHKQLTACCWTPYANVSGVYRPSVACIDGRAAASL
jgi:hypothetical protein